ncbi:hypothetical protein F4778DRAFT_786682 [Xylariomycetidae sp. FL2044]|nr:hypothetical protein F4778DRAFT_786682 [Xylariomycetidae sp. FL2044]
MASRRFFEPVVLLRLLPVISSALAMRFSHDQFFFLRFFLAPAHREQAGAIVPSYFRVFASAEKYETAALYSLTALAGTGNLVYRPRGAAGLWYAAGTALTVAHLAFWPKMTGVAQSLLRAGPGEQATQQLRRWLDIHRVRSSVADVPAWACFTVACLTCLQSA